MKLFAMFAACLILSVGVSAETVRLRDGTAIEVRRCEVRGDVLIQTTADGKLRSVPLSYVEVEVLPDRAAMIREAIELTGLRKLTDEISASARQGAAGLGKEGTLDDDIVAHALAEGFAAERLYAVAEQAFRERAANENLQPALDWLRSPFARRMDRPGADGGETLERYLESFSTGTTGPPARRRVELLLRIDRATGTSEAAVEMQASMIRALLSALYPRGPQTYEAIEQAVDDARPRLGQRTRRRIHVSLHFIYRDVTDEELVEYLAYLESENGVWLSRVLLKSLFAAMEDGARRAGEVLAERLRERSKVRA